VTTKDQIRQSRRQFLAGNTGGRVELMATSMGASVVSPGIYR
jgi:hypothetical protein